MIHSEAIDLISRTDQNHPLLEKRSQPSLGELYENMAIVIENMIGVIEKKNTSNIVIEIFLLIR